MGALDAPALRPVWIATANCSITRFDLRADGYVRVLAVNDTRHLYIFDKFFPREIVPPIIRG
jgi:hypothetical protein